VIGVRGLQRNKKNSPGHSNQYSLFTEKNWSVVEHFLQLYRRVLNGDLAENFNILFLQYVFTFTAWKKAHRRTIIKV
jgi:hypothetical protein